MKKIMYTDAIPKGVMLEFTDVLYVGTRKEG